MIAARNGTPVPLSPAVPPAVPDWMVHCRHDGHPDDPVELYVFAEDLEPRTVLVAAPGLARWEKLAFARRAALCMNHCVWASDRDLEQTRAWALLQERRVREWRGQGRKGRCGFLAATFWGMAVQALITAALWRWGSAAQTAAQQGLAGLFFLAACLVVIVLSPRPKTMPHRGGIPDGAP